MSTRSYIGTLDKSGKYRHVYVHYDGEPESRLPLLLKYFKSYSAIKKILDDCQSAKAYISSLFSSKIYASKSADWSDFPKKVDTKSTTILRIVSDTTVKTVDLKKWVSTWRKKDLDIEYIYVFDEMSGKWFWKATPE